MQLPQSDAQPDDGDNVDDSVGEVVGDKVGATVGEGAPPQSLGALDSVLVSAQRLPELPPAGQIMASAIACPAHVVPPVSGVQLWHSQKPKLPHAGVKLTTLAGPVEPEVPALRQHVSAFHQW